MKDTVLYKIMAICIVFVGGVILCISLGLTGIWYVLLAKLRPVKRDEYYESYNKIGDVMLDRFVRLIHCL